MHYHMYLLDELFEYIHDVTGVNISEKQPHEETYLECFDEIKQADPPTLRDCVRKSFLESIDSAVKTVDTGDDSYYKLGLEERAKYIVGEVVDRGHRIYAYAHNIFYLSNVRDYIPDEEHYKKTAELIASSAMRGFLICSIPYTFFDYLKTQNFGILNPEDLALSRSVNLDHFMTKVGLKDERDREAALKYVAFVVKQHPDNDELRINGIEDHYEENEAFTVLETLDDTFDVS